MSELQLPEHPSLEYLRKLAKDRLRELRKKNPRAKLSDAQLAIARDHGFPSWRVLKAEVDRRQSGDTAAFFDACARGDIETVRRLIAAEPELVRATNPAAEHAGWTALHTAAQQGHANVARLLLTSGADPNAREAGDHTYALHWAAAHRHIDIVRMLLDAGSDVQGIGDDHELDVIGWATFFHNPGEARGHNPEVAALLVERGARHHIFSAMSIGDLRLIRSVVERDPKALNRRLSRFENRLTALHFAIQSKRYDILDLLIELKADLEANDLNGHTALEFAMLRGDLEAAKRLRDAGAMEPPRMRAATVRTRMNKLASSIKKSVAMIYAPDVAATLDWYVSIGFKELARFGEDGKLNFAMVSFGGAEIMINMHGKRGDHDVSLWLYTDKVDELYRLLKSRQIESVSAGTGDGIDFVEHINNTFYGAREFGIRDLNGYMLYFIQSLKATRG